MSYQELCQRLSNVYPQGEAQAVVRTVLDMRFGLSLTDIYTGKVNELSSEDAAELEKIMLRLEQAEPVQYVLGEAEFLNRTFRVEPGVLIPRPETEVLCRWIASDCNRPYCALQPPAPLQILDVGTGSGCIAVSLSLDIPNSEVTAWDISGDALLIARNNAISLGASVNFQLQDALSAPENAHSVDIIVSNPPYICDYERKDMARNVLDFEPETALFVPDDNPLLFYRAIAEYGTEALRKGGALYFETNPLHIDAVVDMMKVLGYSLIEMREDQFGKRRFTKAIML
ncbi:peptide chain release factor N(5)-glutamine methyltransferase [Prevotella sp. HUN102]|uniref:peptide chain release factor N(5)-glutamine methyltransferase n=1 Tax=Prevotella sp. HUN102 TaxID=1392486 RepID=UPI0004903F57|nr:peptide chain release factor N(5)-glutamine methyltransferase [Prevotella sp. HUN102]